MKGKVLSALRSADGYVSGQELCEEFGVSRTAIWKVINQLKSEGYSIEAVPNKGYHIIGFPDVVSASEISSRLDTKWAGKTVKYFEIIDSTNEYAKKMADEGAEHGLLVVADEQESGKGRRGRAWSSPKGKMVAMTLLLRPCMRPEKASMITLVMGLAVSRACKRAAGLDVRIKWPNDIVVNGKKLCGILTEMGAEMNEIHYLVIGTGINVNIEEFPEDLSEMATSLLAEMGKRVSRAQLIQYCLEEFEKCYDVFMETQDMTGLLEEYNSLLVNQEREVCVLEPGNEYRGTAKGINRNGELLVETEDGSIREVYAGEVSVRGIYGYV